MSPAEALKHATRIGEIRLALMRAKSAPRVVSFIDMSHEQGQIKKLVRDEFSADLDDLMAFASRKHPDIAAAAEAANLTTSPDFVRALARAVLTEHDEVA